MSKEEAIKYILMIEDSTMRTNFDITVKLKGKLISQMDAGLVIEINKY